MSELNGQAAPFPAPKPREESAGLNLNAPFRWRELLRTVGLLLAGAFAGWGIGWTGVTARLDTQDGQIRDLRGRADHVDRQLERVLDKLDDLRRRLPRQPAEDGGVRAPVPGWQFCAADGEAEGPPPVEMLEDLPDHSVCLRQRKLYEQHRDWLRQQLRVWGWCGGCWDRWLAECNFALAYWQRLAEAQEFHGWGPLYDAQARGFLAGVLTLVGPERFGRLWSPPPCCPRASTPA